MKTEKTAVLAVTSQKKIHNKYKSVHLKYFNRTYFSACCLLILRVSQELKKNTISRKI